MELDQGIPPDHIRKLKTVRNIKINHITNMYKSIVLLHPAYRVHKCSRKTSIIIIINIRFCRFHSANSAGRVVY